MNLLYRDKITFIPEHIIKAYLWSEGIAPHRQPQHYITCVVNFASQPLYFWGKDAGMGSAWYQTKIPNLHCKGQVSGT